MDKLPTIDKDGRFLIQFCGQTQVPSDDADKYQVELFIEAKDIDTRLVRLAVINIFGESNITHLGNGVFKINVISTTKIDHVAGYLADLVIKMINVFYVYSPDWDVTGTNNDWILEYHVHD